MKINLVAVGNLKDSYWKEACAEYLKRLQRFAEVKVVEVAEEQAQETPSAIEIAKRKEGQKILAAAKGKIYLLAVNGKEVSSESFASLVKSDVDLGREITFVIGGSYGTSEEVYAASEQKISFGKITLPHRLMRVVFLEQLYRAFTINNKISYHK